MPGGVEGGRRVSLRRVKQGLEDSAVPLIAMNLDAVAKLAGNILTSKQMGVLARRVEVVFGYFDRFEDKFYALAERSQDPALLGVAERRRQERAEYYAGPAVRQSRLVDALQQGLHAVTRTKMVRDKDALSGPARDQRNIGARNVIDQVVGGEGDVNRVLQAILADVPVPPAPSRGGRPANFAGTEI